MHFKLIVIIGLLGSFFLSCRKKTPEPPVETNLSSGWLVLNEGLFQQNNSTLGWYNLNNQSYTTDFFEQRTNRSLGDTGNDLQRYGGKIYIIVNVSSTLEILDANTGNSLKQIIMQANGQAKQPRSIRFYNGKGYISCYDGFVDVLDTASMSIIKRIPVGSNPEGLAFSNGKLFVANSGGLNAPLMDSTVSVIDLNSETEIQKIVVGMNPGAVLADNSGEIYVITRGNYSTVPSRMHRINSISNIVEENFNFDISGIYPMNDQFIYTYTNFSSGNQAVGVFNPQTETIINTSLIDLTNIVTLYGVQYISEIDKLVCFDAHNYTQTGEVYVFHSNGSFAYKFSAGLNPSRILYYE